MLRFWSWLPPLISIVISILLGCVEGRAQSATAHVASPPVLPANTRVFLRLTKSLYKQDAKPGQAVELTVTSNVVVNGQVLISGGTAVRGSIRGPNQKGKGPSKVFFDLGPVQTTTGETARLAGLRTTSSRSGVGDAISYGGETGVLAPVVIPVFVVAEVFHQKNVLLEEGACVEAQVAEDVALDPAKVLVLPREQYGASARDRLMSPCNSPRVHPISEYRASVERDPNDSAARIGLIEALDDSGDVDTAFVEGKEAIRVWPDHFYLHYLLGKLLVEKNDPDAAIPELQLALQATKNHLSPANCSLGRALELKGDLEAAFRQYRTAFRAHVQDEQCRAAYERLKLQLKK